MQGSCSAAHGFHGVGLSVLVLSRLMTIISSHSKCLLRSSSPPTLFPLMAIALGSVGTIWVKWIAQCNEGALQELSAKDVVLYVWVDDAFVRTHKKLVQVHYLMEILTRQPGGECYLLFCSLN